MSTATNTERKDGRVVAIAGPVIDVEFPRGHLPELNRALEFVVDVDFVRDHIGPNTVALVGSAGTYPHGIIDPIPELAAVASERGVLFHVDACVGGWLLPFWSRLGNINSNPQAIESDGITPYYPDPIYNMTTTLGVEIEGEYRVTDRQLTG